jgi:CHAT domain-containing protein
LQQVDEIEQNQQKTALEFYQSSRLISKALLPDTKLLNNVSKITVIPDAALFYLPFEVLLSEDRDFKNYAFQEMPFLIKKFAIRYAYSLQVLDKQKSPKRNLYLSAVAPLYGFENNQLQGLTNDSELTNLSNLYQGSFYKNKKISKSDLLKIIAQRPDILHLAMHASAPDTGGAYFILSNNEQLAVHEISKFNLDNTAMIVLSACETGLGAQTKGEGLMSLGRAFAYSGAASVVNTLWPLHDHSAVVLMKLF